MTTDTEYEWVEARYGDLTYGTRYSTTADGETIWRVMFDPDETVYVKRPKTYTFADLNVGDVIRLHNGVICDLAWITGEYVHVIAQNSPFLPSLAFSTDDTRPITIISRAETPDLDKVRGLLKEMVEHDIPWGAGQYYNHAAKALALLGGSDE